jgi:hypothetical protein
VSTARRRLGKRHVEELLGRYDDDPETALVTALRVVLGRPTTGDPDPGELDRLVALAGVDATRADAIAERRPEALDQLAAELNELRTLP